MTTALLFVQNIPWILIAVAFAALLAFIAYRLIKAKKDGKSSCGCGCGQCAMRDVCHAQKSKNSDQKD